MKTLIILQALLILHLTGLTLMAGTTVADFITFKIFSKLLKKDKERAISLLNLMKKLSGISAIGAILLIFSGIGLLIVTNGVFVHQVWFKIKLTLIFILILNGFLVGTRQELRLKNDITGNDPDAGKKTESALLNLRIFYLLQMTVFFAIIFLSVFKFG